MDVSEIHMITQLLIHIPGYFATFADKSCVVFYLNSGDAFVLIFFVADALSFQISRMLFREKR
jgi:hypothetical protein